MAAAGYRVVAPDQRGYARSEQPPDVSSYTLLHLVADVLALIEELGEERAVVVAFRRLLAGASGDNPLGREPRPLVIPDGLGLLATMPD
ncbi:alpha/beta fold hydrolase [Streptomyces sp. NEAU-S77]|uniref:alpha/beta fold hydrolase n=1 Tax=Streptomyces sp. NEAU-S77 TaxID=3411033 RepID=UPI003BA00D72